MKVKVTKEMEKVGSHHQAFCGGFCGANSSITDQKKMLGTSTSAAAESRDYCAFGTLKNKYP